MNALYGRFGISAKSTHTEICNKERKDEIALMPTFIDAAQLSNQQYLVTYHTNTDAHSDSEWIPPRIAAVQLAAAITACARMHMCTFRSVNRSSKGQEWAYKGFSLYRSTQQEKLDLSTRLDLSFPSHSIL